GTLRYSAQEFHRPRGIVSRCIDCHDRAQLVRMLRCINQYVMTTHRMTDQHRGAIAPVANEIIEVRDVVPRPVFPFLRPLAVTVTAQIQRERMKAIDEVRRNEVPPMTVRGAAVNEQDRRLALASIVDAIQTESIDDEGTFVHGVVALGGRNFATRFIRVTILAVRSKAPQPLCVFALTLLLAATALAGRSAFADESNAAKAHALVDA